MLHQKKIMKEEGSWNNPMFTPSYSQLREREPDGEGRKQGIMYASVIKKSCKEEGSEIHSMVTPNLGGTKHYMIYMSKNSYFQLSYGWFQRICCSRQLFVFL